MPRTLPTSANNAIATGHRANHVRVFINDGGGGGGTFRNLASLSGYDWVKSVAFTESADTNVVDCKFEFIKQQDDLSLSNLRTDSALNLLTGGYIPLIELNREIYVEVAIVAPLQSPGASDWVEVFRGRTDDIDWGPRQTVAVRARDLGGRLIDAWSEVKYKYGSEAGTAIETVIQDILDNASSAIGTVTLHSETGTTATPFQPADSPGFAVILFEQDLDSIMSQMQRLAEQIGYSLRYEWLSTTTPPAFHLVLKEPDRAKTTADITIGPDKYFDVTRLGTQLATIRNVISVLYGQASNELRTRTKTLNGPSITKYGRRFMEIAEGEASQIDTVTEAEALRDAVISDLREPDAEQAVSLPYRPDIQVGDLIEFEANGVHYNANQKLAVFSVAHSVGVDNARTSVTCRGKPTLGARRWIGKSRGARAIAVAQDSMGAKQEQVSVDQSKGIVPNDTFSSFYGDPADTEPYRWDTFGAPWGTGDDGVYFDETLTRSGANSVIVNIDTTSLEIGLESNYFRLRQDAIYLWHPVYLRDQNSIVIRRYIEMFDESRSSLGTLSDSASGAPLPIAGNWEQSSAPIVVRTFDDVAAGATGYPAAAWARVKLGFEESFTVPTFANIAQALVLDAPARLKRANRFLTGALLIPTGAAWTPVPVPNLGSPANEDWAGGLNNEFSGVYTVQRDGDYDIEFSVTISLSSGELAESALFVDRLGGVGHVPVFETAAGAAQDAGGGAKSAARFRSGFSRGDRISVGARHNAVAGRSVNVVKELTYLTIDEVVDKSR